MGERIQYNTCRVPGKAQVPHLMWWLPSDRANATRYLPSARHTAAWILSWLTCGGATCMSLQSFSAMCLSTYCIGSGPTPDAVVIVVAQYTRMQNTRLQYNQYNTTQQAQVLHLDRSGEILIVCHDEQALLEVAVVERVEHSVLRRLLWLLLFRLFWCFDCCGCC